MKLLFITLLISVSLSAQNQTETPIKCDKYESISAKMNFEENVKQGKITVYLQGGIVSVVKNADLEFASNHGIFYHDFGCMAPGNISYYEKYNRYVFNYLLEKFGKTWIPKMNSNAFGFQKWTSQT